jgi:hypothetical protein
MLVGVNDGSGVNVGEGEEVRVTEGFIIVGVSVGVGLRGGVIVRQEKRRNINDSEMREWGLNFINDRREGIRSLKCDPV